jgi:hypothetical protein
MWSPTWASILMKDLGVSLVFIGCWHWTIDNEIEPILSLQFYGSTQMVMWSFGWTTETLIECLDWRILLGFPSFELGACILRFWGY